MESDFSKLFIPEETKDSKFVSTATFRTTRRKTGTLNVAAYTRVSTDMSDQENSYETQERYFNQLIGSNPDWNAVGVYSDYGISGTSKEKRTGFRRLLRHCKEGKIDRIVCKSISRFARNTADFMAFVRMIYRDMRWDWDNTYRLEGKSIPGQQLVSFDLYSPFLVENGLALNETTNPTKPLCGEEMSSAESSSASSIKRDSGAV